MSYVGPRPDSQIYAQPAIDYFSGNGSTTSFTLSRPVVSTAQMIVSVANVIQNPGSAFTVNGTTLQFTGTPPAGTNNIWVQYTTPITQINQPGQGTVGTAQMMDAAVTASKIADATITPGKLTVGAISWDSAGRVTMPYQPAFQAYKADDGNTVAAGVFIFNVATVNVGGHYNTTTGRFTAPIAGKYRFETTLQMYGVTGYTRVNFAKNGTSAVPSGGESYDQTSATNLHATVVHCGILSLAAGDYVEVVRGNGTRGMQSSFNGYLLG